MIGKTSGRLVVGGFLGFPMIAFFAESQFSTSFDFQDGFQPKHPRRNDRKKNRVIPLIEQLHRKIGRPSNGEAIWKII